MVRSAVAEMVNLQQFTNRQCKAIHNNTVTASTTSEHGETLGNATTEKNNSLATESKISLYSIHYEPKQTHHKNY